MRISKLNVIKNMLVGFICLLVYFSTPLINPFEPKELQSAKRYVEEEVHFFNIKAGIKLSGTLTYPKTKAKCPAVVLISGGGQQDRDATTGKHRTFFVLADYLTKNGIAVLRFDDRGVGKSEGKFNFLTTTKADIADDVLAAYQYLLSRSEINVKKIGFIGHSEGGIISMMAALKTTNVAFIVLLAAPGLNGGTTLSLQISPIARSFGINETTITKYQDILDSTMRILKDAHNKKRAKQDIAKMYTECSNKIEDPERNSMLKIGYDFPKDPDAFAELVYSPGWNDFLTYEPSIIIKEIKCPILVLVGEKDMQVPSKDHFKAIRSALKEGRTKDYTVKELPGLNHLFQSAITGSPIEYEKIEETISPIALKTIMEWLLKRVN
jgi:hypothetical protein